MTAEDSGGQDYVEIVLDGIARNWINLKKGVHAYIIEQGLPDGEHTLEIHKRTGILTGNIAFHHFLFLTAEASLPRLRPNLSGLNTLGIPLQMEQGSVIRMSSLKPRILTTAICPMPGSVPEC